MVVYDRVGLPSHAALYTTVSPSGAKRAVHVVPFRKVSCWNETSAVTPLRKVSPVHTAAPAITTASPIRSAGGFQACRSRAEKRFRPRRAPTPPLTIATPSPTFQHA